MLPMEVENPLHNVLVVSNCGTNCPQLGFEEILVGFDHFLEFDAVINDGAPRWS
jgi:hypothetical protein